MKLSKKSKIKIANDIWRVRFTLERGETMKDLSTGKSLVYDGQITRPIAFKITSAKHGYVFLKLNRSFIERQSSPTLQDNLDNLGLFRV